MMRTIPKLLLLILAGFTLLSCFYAWLFPPFEGPDERQHFAYIEWLVEKSGFPPQGDAAWDTDVAQESSQPPFYYLIASIPARVVGVNNPSVIYRPNPYFSGPFHIVPDNENVALHYPGDVSVLRGGWLALYLARGVTILFGFLLIIATYGLARQVRPAEPQVALIAAGLVAAIPQVIFIGSVVSNDIPAAALSALTLWLLAIPVRQGLTPKRAFVLGIAFGFAALTKASTLALALPIAFALSWLWLSRRLQWAVLIQSGLCLAAGFFLIVGWWYARTWLMYGSFLGLETHDQAPWAGKEPAMFAARWLETFRTFWVGFGWGTIKLPEWANRILLALSAAAVIGLLLAALRWRRKHLQSPAWPERFTPSVILLVALSLLLAATALALENWMHRVTAHHGRLLFPAVAPIAILLVIGWRALHPLLAAAGSSLVLLTALLSPVALIRPAYALPQLLTAEEIAALPSPIGWRFGDVAELRSLEVLQQSAPAGGILPIRACWRTLAQADRNYTVVIQLTGPNDRVVASRRTYPGMGRYPTVMWQPEQTFCDEIWMHIPDDMPETLVYRVEVGMLDEAAKERLPVYGPDGVPLTHTFVRAVRLTAKTQQLLASEPGDSTEMIRLIGYDLACQQPADCSWQSGQSYPFSLQWVLSEPVSDDYQLFVHLRHPVTGESVAQADGPPLDGWYPTSWWAAGEIVQDQRLLTVPAGITPGEYQLVVGWYNHNSGERLGQEHLLGTIHVSGPSS
jgi:4-amino-4-deoxy-L-arabinose transferase-like glycosyltransferase